MARKKSDVNQHPNASIDELQAYLRNELPLDRRAEIKEMIDSSYFYQRVLDGLKADSKPSVETEKKAFTQLAGGVSLFFSKTLQSFWEKCETNQASNATGFKVAFP